MLPHWPDAGVLSEDDGIGGIDLHDPMANVVWKLRIRSFIEVDASRRPAQFRRSVPRLRPDHSVRDRHSEEIRGGPRQVFVATTKEQAYDNEADQEGQVLEANHGLHQDACEPYRQEIPEPLNAAIRQVERSQRIDSKRLRLTQGCNGIASAILPFASR